MLNQFVRTQMVIGEEALEKLHNSKVCVFGVGGVGGYVIEALARSGVGEIDIVDNDKICLTNLNRQIIATRSSIGRYKVDVMKDRIHEINPDAVVNVHKCFYLPETRDEFNFAEYDYVVDAIDTVTAKIDIILQCQATGTPIISSMGTGNKLNPAMLEVTDIYKTENDPLARVMRRELKKRDIRSLKVVYSKEKALKPLVNENNDEVNKSGDINGAERRIAPGSTSFVPPVAGLIAASEVIKDLIKDEFARARNNG